MTELHTERLRLRQWRDEDAAHLERLAHDPRFMRYLGDPSPGEEQLARYREYWARNGHGIWALEEKATGAFVGRAGLHRHRLWPADVECGWSLDPAFWGRGYATEAGAEAMRHAFESIGVERLISIVHPENVPSIRVCERLGERPHATVPWDDRGIDLVVYAIEREEWRRRKASLAMPTRKGRVGSADGPDLQSTG